MTPGEVSYWAAVLGRGGAAVVVTDEHCVITDWNLRASVLFGWPASEATGNDTLELAGDPNAESPNPRDPGAPFDTHVVITPFVNAGGERGGMIAIATEAGLDSVKRSEDLFAAIAKARTAAHETSRTNFEPHVPGVDQLSRRERDVIRLLRDGLRVPTVAKRLGISESTVRNHLSSIFRKLNVRSQRELLELLNQH